MPSVREIVLGNERQFTQQDHAYARSYADSFRRAIFEGNDELMYQLHQELNQEYMFYILVNTKLTAPEIRFIRSCIKERQVTSERLAKGDRFL